MFEGDPAKQQYLIFSVVITVIISFLINFVFFDFMKDTFMYGWPLSLTDVTGINSIVNRLVNTVVISILLVVPVYLFMRWIEKKANL